MADAKRRRGGPIAQDLTGQKFGLLTVLSRAANLGKYPAWNVSCECGGSKVVSGDNLRGGRTKSCGCLWAQKGRVTKTREYSIWTKMLARCYRKENDNYRFYGAIGHYVCKRWQESFSEFIADLGKAPSSKHTLDRVDTLGHYTCGKCDECREKEQPPNCRWATKFEQARNMKNNLWYTHNGRTLILKDWARELGIDYHVFYNRLFRDGKSFEDVVTQKLAT